MRQTQSTCFFFSRMRLSCNTYSNNEADGNPYKVPPEVVDLELCRRPEMVVSEAQALELDESI